MLESSSLMVKMDFDGPVDTAISTDVQQHLVATVREALSNTNRHAKASRVDVMLHVGSDVVLRVIDDGVGIPVDKKAHGGLLNLGARAHRLGGTMVLCRPPAGGTELEWRVPHRRQADNGAS
jgi:signal transduction histidine kinase